ncbi:transcriptional regulator, TetR family [Granulicella rosea]|uniref:Transcriptional regulator, TetR family n=1 Tax=Granulicella rosea TaxID=474952 RepID=A0A239DLY4_9BACT|nr:TetR/AcrR family transcriptional regulator [Granulicella rosea]SNS33540.1 transcriptional regulator, TetR family [Granulicella rosea]
MGSTAPAAFEARKTPVQARSGVTVDAIHEAAIQVLLSHGPDRLTTTRVATRAGVSVGTLYQYYPHKQALLYAVMERHLNRVVAAVERACGESLGKPIPAMVDAVIQSFVDAKMERADVSRALYAVAAEMNSISLIRHTGERARTALAAMLRTAPGARFERLEETVQMLYAAMAGTTRHVMENGARPEAVGMLRRELRMLAESYLLRSADGRGE